MEENCAYLVRPQILKGTPIMVRSTHDYGRKGTKPNLNPFKK